MISSINRKGYGLTFGLHTRIEARVQDIVDGVHAGNIYVNRNQIGAVVGSQPFGGEGLSGTGPKAGGPHYLRRFRRSASAGGLSAEAGAVPAKTLAEHLPDPALGGWAMRADRIAILRKHLRGKGADAIAAAASVDFGPVDLPGPTGEANTLTLHPRGAFCVSDRTPIRRLPGTIRRLRRCTSPWRRAQAALQFHRVAPVAAIDGVVDPESLEALAVMWSPVPPARKRCGPSAGFGKGGRADRAARQRDHQPGYLCPRACGLHRRQRPAAMQTCWRLHENKRSYAPRRPEALELRVSR